MDKKIFSELTSDELKMLYAEILKAREDGGAAASAGYIYPASTSDIPLDFRRSMETHRAAVLGRSCKKVLRTTLI